MTIVTLAAYYNSTCSPGKSCKLQDANPHKVSENVGKFVAAFIVIGGLITLYALSICGAQGMGPLAHISFTRNLAICGTLGGIDSLTILGIALRALGCGKKTATPSQEA